ncbi:MAG: hypothetical protein H6841_07985 [Planctomycetes bacterium]|nr:hypothetical protein [Planctomycetota bacterium]MCB9935465.1 hypothetical protein [Planctomycetota bacterium]
MSPTREYSHARWHSRAGFLMTTLLVLLVMGAPLLVTRGILTHGALFLPAAAGLVLLFGGPLTRLALATGRLDHRATGRESLQGVQSLIRLVLAAVLLVLAGRACAWLYAEALFGVPQGALDYQARELTTHSTAWHSATTPAAWWGMGTVVVIAFVLVLFARRKRLAGLSWLAVWLLAVVVALMLLGLLVGYSMPGAGALAALAAPVRLESALSLAFWGEAAAVAMLAIGAQTGVLVAAGRGLPKRATVGREARILVAGVTLLLVMTGLAGLLLLSAVCYRQGIVPEPEHAAPGVLVLDVIPALGADLFQGWPPEFKPSTRQVTLAWCFIVTLACGIGAAAMLGAGRLLPRDARTAAARFGYAAAGVCFAALIASLAMGTGDSYLPLLTVMPALLAVILVTMARRAGVGMRVVSVAFHSKRPWLERLYLTLAFRVVRPLLLLAVLAVALSRREYNIMLASFAVAFAMIWLGSLRRRMRSRETGMLRAVAAAALLVMPLVLHAQEAVSPVEAAFARVVDAPDAAQRAEARRRFEELALRSAAEGGEPVYTPALRARAAALLDQEGPPRLDVARDAAGCVFLLDPTHEDSLRLERQLLEHDGVSPFPRLDEAFSDYQAGQTAPLRERLGEVATRIHARRVTVLLEQDDPPVQQLMIALASDLRQAYGSAAPRTRELRRYLVQRATGGRSLLRPDAGPGVTYLACFLAAAGIFALALMFGIGERRNTRR